MRVLIVFQLCIFPLFAQRNNVCNNFFDYFFLQISPNCYHNPDVFSYSPEIIKRHFGVEYLENHNVTTEDGYILGLFRIKRKFKMNRGVIILQHPVGSDGVVFLLQGKTSLAYVLWEEGYEIWIPNHRGTFFSRGHVNMTTNDFKYWDFSFHEIALYDYSKIIKHIAQVSNSTEMGFIGHSMSGTSALILASLMSDFAKQHLKIMVLMSTAAILKNLRTPLKYITYLEEPIKKFNEKIQWGALFRPESIETLIRKVGFSLPFKFQVTEAICLFTGGSPKNTDPAINNVLLSVTPDTYSWKVLYHFAQIYKNNGDFVMYDYGKKINQKLYNQPKPPKYPLENITVPSYLVASADDSMGTLKDNELIYAALREEAKIYGNLTVEGINHVDYHVGKNRFPKVYNKVLELFDVIYPKPR